jgi:prolyl-tRNA synthetase
LPVIPKEENRASVLDAAHRLAARLREQTFHGAPVRVEVDSRDIGGGAKNWEWIKRGVPLRMELGPRDLEKGTVAVARRDRSPKEKVFPAIDQCVGEVGAILQQIQDGLLERATAYRDANTVRIDTREEFYAFFTARNPDKPEIHGGFALAHWNGSPEVEQKIKEDLKVTIRCIPFPGQVPGADEPGRCVITGEPSSQRVLFAKSY